MGVGVCVSGVCRAGMHQFGAVLRAAHAKCGLVSPLPATFAPHPRSPHPSSPPPHRHHQSSQNAARFPTLSPVGRVVALVDLGRAAAEHKAQPLALVLRLVVLLVCGCVWHFASRVVSGAVRAEKKGGQPPTPNTDPRTRNQLTLRWCSSGSA